VGNHEHPGLLGHLRYQVDVRRVVVLALLVEAVNNRL
jgi:hypothetical protein